MRVVGLDEPGPLPDNPALAAVAEALNDARQRAEIYDPSWCMVYATDDGRRVLGGLTHLAPYLVGVHRFGPERVEMASGPWSMDIIRQNARAWLPAILGDTPGGREELRTLVDPRLHDIVDEVETFTAPEGWTIVFRGLYRGTAAVVSVIVTLLRVRDDAGRIVGTTAIFTPTVGMAVVARITGLGDRRHFERLERVATPGPRAAAILFADLESSSALARRLATASFFSLVRRLARVADQAIVDAGGIAGQHAGDGVVGFFLAAELGSESAAARACVAAARAMRDGLPAVAAKSDLDASDLQLRFGLHWGSNVYVGQIGTSARTEVTGLGDQINETARIEACATGARTLASKDLIEQLDADDAAALDLDPRHMTYTSLADLGSATDKARRDAPSLAVGEI